MNSFTILAPTSPYGNIVTQSFRNSVQNAHGLVAEMELYDPNSPDYTQVVERIATAYQNNPFDALMLPEGGARLRQLAPLLRTVARRNRIVGMDIVEIAPSYDFANGLTCIAAGRLLLNVLGSSWGEGGAWRRTRN